MDCSEQDWNLKYKKDGANSYFITEHAASPHDPPGGLVRSSASPSLLPPSPYASSLRSTHIPTEVEESPAPENLPQPSPPTGSGSGMEHLGFPDALNFNPTLNTSSASTFDGYGFGASEGSLFPPDGIFDWGQCSPPLILLSIDTDEDACVQRVGVRSSRRYRGGHLMGLEGTNRDLGVCKPLFYCVRRADTRVTSERGAEERGRRRVVQNTGPALLQTPSYVYPRVRP